MNTKWILRVATSALFTLPCLAANLNNPDTACNPALDPPVSNGCTWYNFYAQPDGTIQSGSSFSGYYSVAPAPPWTITTTAAEVIRVVDGGHQGDVFDVYDNGVLLGETSATPIDANHSCANDPTGAGTDPAACWNDPLMSHGTFPLPAGNHSITVVWKQMVAGGMSSLQWFEIGNATASTGGGLTFTGSMPHIAVGGDWTTTFTLVNKGGTPSETAMSTFADSGLALALPLNLVQTSTNLLTQTLDQTVPANASLIASSSGDPQSTVQVGSAQVKAAGTMDGFAIFHINSSSQEAVVPLETRNAAAYILAFDNTSNVATGVALENISTQAANINVVIRNDSGAQIGTGNIPLPASGHTSFVLADQYGFTAGIRGTMEFDTPAGGQISALGFRYTPVGTITTLPMLTSTGATGGSFAHFPVQGGYTTTIVLVNTGTSAANATLNFYGDSGSPLSVALTFPQSGTTTAASPTTTQTLAAGATLMVQNSNSSGALQNGSAQLTTNGSVTGFVIFHYGPNSQEAVVPMESRNANSYLVAFDNTSSTATGIAVNNASNSTISVPVVVRNDTGAQIATGSIPLAANGHSSFVLSDQFPATANIRGTIELDQPSGASIGVVGIRVPQAITLTTLPALAR